MLYVTVDLSTSREDWHLNTLGRIIKGIKGLEKKGFKVERYQGNRIRKLLDTNDFESVI